MTDYIKEAIICQTETEQGREQGLGERREKSSAYSMWFYGAADHLLEMQIPETLSPYLKGRIKKFIGKVLAMRLSFEEEKQATLEDFNWARQEARDLLRLIDKHHGYNPEKGEFE